MHWCFWVTLVTPHWYWEWSIVKKPSISSAAFLLLTNSLFENILGFRMQYLFWNGTRGSYDSNKEYSETKEGKLGQISSSPSNLLDSNKTPGNNSEDAISNRSNGSDYSLYSVMVIKLIFLGKWGLRRKRGNMWVDLVCGQGNWKVKLTFTKAFHPDGEL